MALAVTSSLSRGSDTTNGAAQLSQLRRDDLAGLGRDSRGLVRRRAQAAGTPQPAAGAGVHRRGTAPQSRPAALLVRASGRVGLRARLAHLRVAAGEAPPGADPRGVGGRATRRAAGVV